MHTRGLAVHPYTLQDDHVVYTANGTNETEMFVNKGVDGIFTEFVSATYTVFK